MHALPAAAVLAAHNRRHGTAYELVRKFPEGRNGAWEVRGRGPDGPLRAVLKVDSRLSFARRGRRRRPVSEVARAAGYPTPEIIGWGGARTPYYLQAFVSGRSVARLTPDLLDQALAIVALQAGLRPDTPQEWSGYVHRVVFDGESGWTPALRAHSPTSAALLRTLESVAAPCRDVDLGDADFVHGDFASWNLLAAGGRIVAVVDAQAAGRGNRAIDLARVYGWDYADTDAPMRRRLLDAILAATSPLGARLSLVYTAIDLLTDALLHGNRGEARAAARVARALAADGLRLG